MLPEKVPTYLTFDDVLLLPGYSAVLPNEVNVATQLTRNIRLNCPLVSSPMDTVTEAELAIALAQEGGIGIIHRNMDPNKQRKHIDRVKRSVSIMIPDPITLEPSQKVGHALQVMKKYNITGIPITNEKKLVGILTNRDLWLENNHDRPISELMTKDNLITIPEGTTIKESKKILHENRIEKLPVVDAKGYLKGLITVKDIEKAGRYPNAAKDSRGRLLVGAALGVGGDYLGPIQSFIDVGLDVLAIDSAHGHSQKVLEAVREIKTCFPKLEVIGGNVATAEGALALIEAGADAIKVGIGPGSICTTRVVSGVGVPQVSAVAECSRVADKNGIPVISDGGIKFSGDITKAIAAGGYAVMIGSLFAGTDESPGKKILFQGQNYKEYRGMGSIESMTQGSGDRYFQNLELSDSKLVPEGVEARVPYRGSLAFNVHQLLGGLRAGMGYCGCATIPELRQKSRFIKITSAGLKESHVHDVIVTKEAPNYNIE
ncbi:MAG: IMP dehydrogenase [Nitrospinales bacterium]